MKYSEIWKNLIKKEENRIRKEIKFKKENPKLFYFFETMKSLLFWLLLIVLIGCSEKNKLFCIDDKCDFTENSVIGKCLGREKIVNIYDFYYKHEGEKYRKIQIETPEEIKHTTYVYDDNFIIKNFGNCDKWELDKRLYEIEKSIFLLKMQLIK